MLRLCVPSLFEESMLWLSVLKVVPVMEMLEDVPVKNLFSLKV